jgi:hypothetical protein
VSYILTEDYEPGERRNVLDFPSEIACLPNLSDAEVGKLMAEETKRLTRQAIADHYARRIIDGCLEGDYEVEPEKPVVRGPLTDAHANPSESRCSETRLRHILAERDEHEARQAAKTVRPINGGDAA